PTIWGSSFSRITDKKATMSPNQLSVLIDDTSKIASLPRTRSLSWSAGSSDGEDGAKFFESARLTAEGPTHSLPPQGIRPLVICGPSGVGKGTLIAKLTQRYPDAFGFSVSHTTRGPRPGEEHGVHYFFAEKKVMRREIEGGAFLEHAEVHGNLYGTSIAAVASVQAAGKICLLDIDVQSVRAAGRDVIDAVSLFVAPPSMGELESRLRGRGTETEDKVLLRLKNARAEVDFGTATGNFDKVVVNDNLERALTELDGLLAEWYPHLGEPVA
ncbi:unnamed protein product, partial [Phaeothamnion confervicola]